MNYFEYILGKSTDYKELCKAVQCFSQKKTKIELLEYSNEIFNTLTEINSQYSADQLTMNVIGHRLFKKKIFNVDKMNTYQAKLHSICIQRVIALSKLRNQGEPFYDVLFDFLVNIILLSSSLSNMGNKDKVDLAHALVYLGDHDQVDFLEDKTEHYIEQACFYMMLYVTYQRYYEISQEFEWD